MNYIVANYDLVRVKINTTGMPRSKDGKVIITDKNLQAFAGETPEERLASVSGNVISNKEAKHLLTLKNWKI